MQYPLVRRSKWKMHQRYRKFQSQNVLIFGCVYHSKNGQNHGPIWKIQSFLLNGICTVILWQDSCWERQFEKILLKHGWEKIPNWECLFVHREKGLFLSVYVDDIKLAGKKHNIDPMWKVLHKEGDLGEPTSFLDHVYLGCTQRQCEISKDVVENYRDKFESRNLVQEDMTKETLPSSGRPVVNISPHQTSTLKKQTKVPTQHDIHL